MSAPYHALRADLGARWRQTFYYEQPDTTPVDLTGATVTVTVLEADATVLATVTTDGLEDGRIDVDLDTEGWPPGRLAYTVEVTRDGTTDRILVGALDSREAHRV